MTARRPRHEIPRAEALPLIQAILNATIADRKVFRRMTHGEDDLRNDIAAAARAFSRLKYVHAFGHVSQRLEHSFLITPTRPPLAVQCAADILEVDFDGKVISGDPAARPIEVFLHIGIYSTRADIRAICRTHAPCASTWPENGEAPPVQHGFGGIAGTVATCEMCDLIHTAGLGAAAAARLGSADALVLRGNGVLSVGRTLGEAAARMWGLEERCAQGMRQGTHGSPFSAEDLAARSRWYPAEAERIWTWLKYLGSLK
jgi:HCOMODA/2-hydroxy-3-carboxy-muconic semialdehyde decarboxylase